MKTVLIAIPTDRGIEPETFVSIYNLKVPKDVITKFQYFYGYQVDQVRNLIAEWGKQYDYTLCVDSDIVLPEDCLQKMIDSDKSIVSGLYLQKTPDNLLELYEDTSVGQTNILASKVVNTGLIEVSACGFGCVLVKREVFTDIPYPHFYYTSALTMEHTISEDVYFCNKAKSFGHKIYADTSILCPHIGKFTFSIPEKENNSREYFYNKNISSFI